MEQAKTLEPQEELIQGPPGESIQEPPGELIQEEMVQRSWQLETVLKTQVVQEAKMLGEQGHSKLGELVGSKLGAQGLMRLGPGTPGEKAPSWSSLVQYTWCKWSWC